MEQGWVATWMDRDVVDKIAKVDWALLAQWAGEIKSMRNPTSYKGTARAVIAEVVSPVN